MFPNISNSAPAAAGTRRFRGRPAGWLLVAFCFTATAFADPPTIRSAVNAFDYSTHLCPGALANIFGTNFGSSTTGVSVTVGGKPTYLVAVFPNQIAAQIPFEASPGPTVLTVTVAGAASAPLNITLDATAPALNTISQTGSGAAAIVTPSQTIVNFGAPAHPNDALTTYATGLGATNPATATGVVPAMASPPQPAVTPALTIGGTTVQITYAKVATQAAGLFQINFTVPTGMQGSQPIVLTSGSAKSRSDVTIPIAGLSRLVSNGGFGSAGMAAPGEIATVFANGLGSTDQLGAFPATTAQGAQVKFNGTAAPIFDLIASTAQQKPPREQQIDLLVPQELPTSGTVNVQLTVGSATYPNYTLKMAPAVPGLYRLQDPAKPDRFNIIAQFANTTWLALPASTTSALKLPACAADTSPLSTCGQPAAIGDYLVIYLTGLGITTPGGDPGGKPLATGQVPPVDGSVLYQTPSLPAVTIGGVPTQVLFSGLVPGIAGEYQLDVQVPDGVASGDEVPVVVTMAGNSDMATVSIQPR